MLIARRIACLSAISLLFVNPAYSQDVKAIYRAANQSVGVAIAESANGIVSGTAFIVSQLDPGVHAPPGGTDPGWIALTAYHVVAGARRIYVKFGEFPALGATILRSDRPHDVAVLQFPAIPIGKLPPGVSGGLVDLPPCALDVAMEEAQEGQSIVVIGFPRVDALGIGSSTVTAGIISAARPGLLQIQAPVSPGNSGAPVLNEQAQVVGIVIGTLRGEQQAINFATPISTVRSILPTWLVFRAGCPVKP